MTLKQESLPKHVSVYKPMKVSPEKRDEVALPGQLANIVNSPGHNGNYPKPLDRDDAKYYEIIIATILDHRKREGIQTIAVTASCSEEGTTATSINLATSLVNNFQFRVLLMDMNFRGQGKGYDFEGDQYAEYWGIDSLNRNGFKVRKRTAGGLTVVSFDGDEFNPIQSFKGSELMRILDEQKDFYDFIILDSAPVSQYSDTRILSSMVDGIILVVESGKTRRQVVARSKEIIMESGGNILGVVLNKTKHYIPDWIYKRL